MPTFKDDKLNREKYADFLTEIIANASNYKRISDSNSFTLAIDSSWGTGKTTFLNMWVNKLRESNNFIIITYNAWKNDFINNSFESLMYTILEDEAIKELLKEFKIEIKAKLIKTAISISKKYTEIKIKNKIGEEAYEDLSNFLSKDYKEYSEREIDKIQESFCKDYKEYLEAIEELKEVLRELSKEKPIIIVIDELDRCKPLFSINILESIKHIFDVENVSFVFALDMEQLSYSIKCIYGESMDANGYLCRFFDYISKMPKIDPSLYISELFITRPIKKAGLINYTASTSEEANFLELLRNLSIAFNLSLRDLNTIYANFLIFENFELKNTNCAQAYSLYLVLLILKYKYSPIYKKIFIDKTCKINEEEIFSRFGVGENPYFNRNTLTIIMKKQAIKDIIYDIKNGYVSETGKIDRISSNVIRTNFNYGSKDIVLDSDINLSNCLFYDDLLKWDQIKYKTLSDYIQENLEFFNFEYEENDNENPSDRPAITS